MELESQIGPHEQLLWSGTKDKKVTFMEALFNPMLPFAAIWGLLDFTVIGNIVREMRYDTTESLSQMGKFLIPFFLVHLMPVWMYLGGVLSSVRGAKNTHYCVTDQAIYIQHGIFNTTNERIVFSEILSVSTKQSVFDKKANTGDVVITLDQIIYVGKHHRATQRSVKIENIAEYEDIYRMLMQHQQEFASAQPARAPQNAFQQPFAGFEQAAAQSKVYQRYMNAQMPQYGSQPQQYGAPQVPQYGSQPQQYGAPQVPQYGSQPQQYGTPQVPQYGAQPQPPQPPPAQPPAQEMDTLESLSAPDEFHDPTLSAFDFQKNDPFDNSGF